MGCLFKVIATNFRPFVMAVFSVNRHGHFDLVRRKVPGAMPHDRVRGKHIVARGQAVKAFRLDEYAEILGVTVDCGKHPE